MRRVVITGMGAISPLGNDCASTWRGIEENRCGIGPITHFDCSDFKTKLAAEVKDFHPEAYLDKRASRFNDRFVQFARVASMQAMEQSQLHLSDEEKHRFGVLLASGIGGIETIETSEKRLMERGNSRVSPYFIPMALINLAAGQVAIDHQAQGYCSSVVTACAAGTNAIGEAFHKIRDGYQDVMLAGGTEASITPLAVAGFQSMRALHTGSDKNRASIPFDKERSGFVMGEGAAMLVLEEYEHAKARKAPILAEIVGYGMSCDAYHITAPRKDGYGAIMAMQNALADAECSPNQVDYVNAHGTSTPLNDSSETIALKGVFDHPVYVSSTKGNTGHMLGAAGAIEAMLCVEALQHQLIPATISYKVPDPACDLNLVCNENKAADLTYVMSNSLGFGGHNASIILKKMED